jgi:hypothetical protein
MEALRGPETISAPENGSPARLRACARLVHVSYMSRTCLVQGGSWIPREQAHSDHFRPFPPAESISRPYLCLVKRFGETPTAFPSVSSGLRRRRCPGCSCRVNDPEGVAVERPMVRQGPGCCNPFRVEGLSCLAPRVARSRNPGLNDGTPLAFGLALGSGTKRSKVAHVPFGGSLPAGESRRDHALYSPYRHRNSTGAHVLMPRSHNSLCGNDLTAKPCAGPAWHTSDFEAI